MREWVNRNAARAIGGSGFYRFLLWLSDYSVFTYNVLSSFGGLRGKHLDAFLRVVVNQVRFTGAQALPLLSIIALSIGGSTIIQAVTFLPKLGQESFMGNLLRMVIIREVGPLITAIIILTRSGSAIAAELATQKLHKEIDSIEMMGINPFLFLLLPRVIGAVVATLMLIIYFDFVAILGGYFISLLVAPFPFVSFIESVAKSVSVVDIIATLVKALSYGLVIPITCSFYGMKPDTLFEIPIFVSKAVVNSLLSMFLLSALTSVVFYL